MLEHSIPFHECSIPMETRGPFLLAQGNSQRESVEPLKQELWSQKQSLESPACHPSRRKLGNNSKDAGINSISCMFEKEKGQCCSANKVHLMCILGIHSTGQHGRCLLLQSRKESIALSFWAAKDMKNVTQFVHNLAFGHMGNCSFPTSFPWVARNPGESFLWIQRRHLRTRGLLGGVYFMTLLSMGSQLLCLNGEGRLILGRVCMSVGFCILGIFLLVLMVELLGRCVVPHEPRAI